jgi:hypothetical protein
MTDDLRIETRGDYLYIEYSGEFSVAVGKDIVDIMISAWLEEKK